MAIIRGTNRGETLRGTVDFDTLFGGDGNDTLFGGGGNDNMFGGSGNDSMRGDAGNDSMRGDDGNDFMLGGDGNDFMLGGSGNDSMRGDAGNDSMRGDDGNDLMIGGAGRDFMRGGVGNDSMRGEDGDDSIYGDDGDDLILAGNGNDRVVGGTGNDRLFGEAGNDTILGEAGDDQLSGGAGDDTLTDEQGTNTISGGDGTDKAVFALPIDSYIIALGADGSVVISRGDNQTTVQADVENIHFGATVLTLQQVKDSLIPEPPAPPAGQTIIIASGSGGDTGGLGDDVFKLTTNIVNNAGFAGAFANGDAGKDTFDLTVNTNVFTNAATLTSPSVQIEPYSRTVEILDTSSENVEHFKVSNVGNENLLVDVSEHNDATSFESEKSTGKVALRDIQSGNGTTIKITDTDADHLFDFDDSVLNGATDKVNLELNEVGKPYENIDPDAHIECKEECDPDLAEWGIKIKFTEDADFYFHGMKTGADIETLDVTTTGNETSYVKSLRVGEALTTLNFVVGTTDLVVGGKGHALMTENTKLSTIDASTFVNDLTLRIAETGDEGYRNDVWKNDARDGGNGQSGWYYREPNTDFDGTFLGGAGVNTNYYGQSINDGVLGTQDGGAGIDVAVFGNGSDTWVYKLNAFGNPTSDVNTTAQIDAFKNFEVARFVEPFGGNSASDFDGRINAANLDGIRTFELACGVDCDGTQGSPYVTIENLEANQVHTLVIQDDDKFYGRNEEHANRESELSDDDKIKLFEEKDVEGTPTDCEGQIEFLKTRDFPEANDCEVVLDFQVAGDGNNDQIVVDLNDPNLDILQKGDEIEQITYAIEAGGRNNVTIGETMTDLKTVVVTGGDTKSNAGLLDYFPVDDCEDCTPDGDGSFSLFSEHPTTTPALTLVDASGVGFTDVSIANVGAAAGATFLTAAGNDYVSGTRGDDTIDTDGGLDVLKGRDGDDTLLGGAGTDSLKGGGGSDIINGGAGADWMWGDGDDEPEFKHVAEESCIIIVDGIYDGGDKFKISFDPPGANNKVEKSVTLTGANLSAEDVAEQIHAFINKDADLSKLLKSTGVEITKDGYKINLVGQNAALDYEIKAKLDHDFTGEPDCLLIKTSAFGGKGETLTVTLDNLSGITRDGNPVSSVTLTATLQSNLQGKDALDAFLNKVQPNGELFEGKTFAQIIMEITGATSVTSETIDGIATIKIAAKADGSNTLTNVDAVTGGIGPNDAGDVVEVVRDAGTLGHKNVGPDVKDNANSAISLNGVEVDAADTFVIQHATLENPDLFNKDGSLVDCEECTIDTIKDFFSCLDADDDDDLRDLIDFAGVASTGTEDVFNVAGTALNFVNWSFAGNVLDEIAVNFEGALKEANEEMADGFTFVATTYNDKDGGLSTVVFADTDGNGYADQAVKLLGYDGQIVYHDIAA